MYLSGVIFKEFINQPQGQFIGLRGNGGAAKGTGHWWPPPRTGTWAGSPVSTLSVGFGIYMFHALNCDNLMVMMMLKKIYQGICVKRCEVRKNTVSEVGDYVVC